MTDNINIGFIVVGFLFGYAINHRIVVKYFNKTKEVSEEIKDSYCQKAEDLQSGNFGD